MDEEDGATSLPEFKIETQDVEEISKIIACETEFFRLKYEDEQMRCMTFWPPSIPNFVRISTQQKTLPAFGKKEEIVAAIDANQVVLIAGETGCGKTTQVPQYILDHCSRNQKPCRILCALPRRLSVISTAERVSNERNSNLGSEVGYQVGGLSNVKGQASVVFMT